MTDPLEPLPARFSSGQIEAICIPDETLAGLGREQAYALEKQVRESFRRAGIPYRVYRDELRRELVLEPVFGEPCD
jgi:hypothetical protein